MRSAAQTPFLPHHTLTTALNLIRCRYKRMCSEMETPKYVIFFWCFKFTPFNLTRGGRRSAPLSNIATVFCAEIATLISRDHRLTVRMHLIPRCFLLKSAFLVNENEEIILVKNAINHRTKRTQQLIYHQVPYKRTCDKSLRTAGLHINPHTFINTLTESFPTMEVALPQS